MELKTKAKTKAMGLQEDVEGFTGRGGILPPAAKDYELLHLDRNGT